ncbi:MAG TPA: FAD:protein FMN transferase [Candidatus Nanoarchaeia archaeon]|nr:FAD:protein FMN transferase [Candidatus Nanoarchaeia archaeon]
MEEIVFRYKLFGGEIEVVIYNSKGFIVQDIMKDFYKEALRLQNIFNFYDKNSELSILNKKREMTVSRELLKVIEKAIEFSKVTNGKYDVSLGEKFKARKQGKEKEVFGSYKDIKINGNKIKLEKDVSIDLGSIAKGYITDRLSDFLKKSGINNFLIDSRGDMIFYGNEQIVGIQHPRNKDKVICNIKIKDKAIATSGDYNQFYKDYRKSHIINANNVSSVTVIADSLEEADVYATVLFVAGEKEREDIMKSNKKVSALVYSDNLKSRMYNDFKEKVTK